MLRANCLQLFQPRRRSGAEKKRREETRTGKDTGTWGKCFCCMQPFRFLKQKKEASLHRGRAAAMDGTSLSLTRCTPQIQGLLVYLPPFWHWARFGKTDKWMDVLAHWQTVPVQWTRIYIYILWISLCVSGMHQQWWKRPGVRFETEKTKQRIRTENQDRVFDNNVLPWGFWLPLRAVLTCSRGSDPRIVFFP